jgi:hypothetical protein
MNTWTQTRRNLFFLVKFLNSRTEPYRDIYGIPFDHMHGVVPLPLQLVACEFVTTDISRLELSAAAFSFKTTQRGVHDLDHC